MVMKETQDHVPKSQQIILSRASSKVGPYFVIMASTAAMFGTLATLILKAPVAGAWRYFLAGGVCACFSHAIATPIDVIKTRQQVDEGDFVTHMEVRRSEE
jgi:hypothetical protein